MSSMEFILNSRYNQYCVYWGNPKEGGVGKLSFDAPVEVKCRWEDMNQIVTDNKGVDHTSRALVFLPQDVDEEGMLYLGRLTDLTTVQKNDPYLLETAYIIKRFQKTPGLGSNSIFLRKAYLTPSLSFGGF
jgi:hypothetical protein